MPILETMLLGLAVNGAYDLTKEGATRAFNAVKKNRPDLIESAEVAAINKDDEALRSALSGAIEVAAATGHVELQGAILSAVNEARFDHQQGMITIGAAKIYAPTLVTGGGIGATGETTIGGGTTLNSAGTRIEVGQGSFIRVTGNASIKQS